MPLPCLHYQQDDYDDHSEATTVNSLYYFALKLLKPCYYQNQLAHTAIGTISSYTKFTWDNFRIFVFLPQGAG